MKILKYLGILLSFILLYSCDKEEIAVFKGENYVQFSRSLADSLTCSFLGDPTAESVLFPISLDLVGKPSNKDRKIKLKVLDQFTTASKSHYEFPAEIIFGSDHTVDTIWLKVNNTPDLKNEAVKLVYSIESSGDLLRGEAQYSTGVLYFTNKIAKPIWWTGTVQSSYLGTYSDKKYQLFIDILGVVDLDPNNLNQVLEYSLKLKNYLLQEKEADRTVFEVNGVEMTVNVISS